MVPLPTVDGDSTGSPGALALFSKDCDTVLLGQSRGAYLAVLDASTLTWLDVVQVCRDVFAGRMRACVRVCVTQHKCA